MRTFVIILTAMTILSSCSVLKLGGGQKSQASEAFGRALEQTEKSVNTYIQDFWGGELTRDSLRSQLENELSEPLYSACLQVFAEWEEHNRKQGTVVNYVPFEVPTPVVKGELAQLLSAKVLDDITKKFFDAAKEYVEQGRRTVSSEQARENAARAMSVDILKGILKEVEDFLDDREKASYKRS